ncbi:MAG TPA: histidine kinase dimerization/phospho-acceptor domain-containing protein, partial [Candidatus Acidoferrum sp.]|nr:histidine kinase dimerization/phospho-acceptor domain-containing protein [Candidatus Acidoferrum sp.]
MIWDRRRRIDDVKPAVPPVNSFAEVLEDAPLMALLIQAGSGVIDANDAARAFFEIDLARLPASLVEVTLEGSLVEVLAAAETRAEANLVHHRRVVDCTLVPGPHPGETLMFLTDITELRHLGKVRQEFVANLVHELKTPLTSLRLAAESLIGDPATADRKRFAARVIK